MQNLSKLDAYVKGRIDRAKTDKFNPNNEENRRWIEIQKKLITDSILDSDTNKKYFRQFCEIIKDEEYFDIKHIQALGLEYDILIFLSEKNIGKSYNQLTRANEITRRGGKVLMLRILDTDIHSGLSEQLNTDPHSELSIDNKGKLYRKRPIDPHTGKEYGFKRYCGLATSLKGAQKWKGSSYDGYEMMFFDEATDERDQVDLQDWKRFFISFANSFERRKETIPMEIYGNTDFSSTHPLFECFGIDPEENFIYSTRKIPGVDRATRILYINSRGMYPRGARMSKFIGAIGDVAAARDAFTNSVKKSSSRITSLDLGCLGDPHMCLIWSDSNHDIWQLVISKYNYRNKDVLMGINEDEMWYHLKVEPFDPRYLYGYKLITDELVLRTVYKDFMAYRSDLTSHWMRVRNIIRGTKCIFYGDISYKMLNEVVPKKTKDLKIMVG